MPMTDTPKADPPCCDDWARARKMGTDAEGYNSVIWDSSEDPGEDAPGLPRMGCIGFPNFTLPPVLFCPWCGHDRRTPVLPPHLRDEPIFIQCSRCGRKSYSGRGINSPCRMTQPDGSACPGIFKEPVAQWHMHGADIVPCECGSTDGRLKRDGTATRWFVVCAKCGRSGAMSETGDPA